MLYYILPIRKRVSIIKQSKRVNRGLDETAEQPEPRTTGRVPKDSNMIQGLKDGDMVP